MAFGFRVCIKRLGSRARAPPRGDGALLARGPGRGARATARPEGRAHPPTRPRIDHTSPERRRRQRRRRSAAPPRFLRRSQVVLERAPWRASGSVRRAPRGASCRAGRRVGRPVAGDAWPAMACRGSVGARCRRRRARRSQQGAQGWSPGARHRLRGPPPACPSLHRCRNAVTRTCCHRRPRPSVTTPGLMAAPVRAGAAFACACGAMRASRRAATAPTLPGPTRAARAGCHTSIREALRGWRSRPWLSRCRSRRPSAQSSRANLSSIARPWRKKGQRGRAVRPGGADRKFRRGSAGGAPAARARCLRATPAVRLQQRAPSTWTHATARRVV